MIEISLPRLLLSLAPLLIVAWLMVRWSGDCRELLMATGRMLLQLLLVGYVLVFLFQVENLWVHLGVVAFMVGMSSWIAIRTVKENRMQAYRDALLAIGLGGGAVFALVVFGVLGLGSDAEARYLIPLAGMIFANGMTAVTLSAERFDAERLRGIELLEARNIAWRSSLIPQINSFLAVGLVSIPGMMTGQILAGASPLSAVRYQIMVMAMILGSAGLAVALFLMRRVQAQRRSLKNVP